MGLISDAAAYREPPLFPKKCAKCGLTFQGEKKQTRCISCLTKKKK
jgi:predicted Zn-ribbon and HTH transcriptional regulator